MLLATLLAAENAGSLGGFKAPSSAYAPQTADAAAGTVDRLISVGLGGITLIAMIYFLFVMAIAAFNWLGSEGDSGKISKARDSIIHGLLGLVILVATYAVIGIVGRLFGIDILNTGNLILQLKPETVIEEQQESKTNSDSLLQEKSNIDRTNAERTTN